MPGRQAGDNVKTLGEALARMVAEALFDKRLAEVKGQTHGNALA